MNIIEKYNKALEDIYNHVGFQEDWVVYPIDDRTHYYWKIKCSISVGYGKDKKTVINETGEYYEDEIYTQRFYTKHVYRGETYTLIFCDPHVDGMKYFAIYSNDKEMK